MADFFTEEDTILLGQYLNTKERIKDFDRAYKIELANGMEAPSSNEEGVCKFTYEPFESWKNEST